MHPDDSLQKKSTNSSIRPDPKTSPKPPSSHIHPPQVETQSESHVNANNPAPERLMFDSEKNDSESSYTTPDPSFASRENSVAEEILLEIKNVQARLAVLGKAFEGKLRTDRHKEKIIDDLHRELQGYRADIGKKPLQSLIMDVIKVADDIRKYVAHCRGRQKETWDPAKFLEYLESIPQELEDLLSVQDVLPYHEGVDIVDPSRQRVVKRVLTSDIGKDKTVAERLRPGYEWEGRVIRPEMVAVYVYQQSLEESAEARSPDDERD